MTTKFTFKINKLEIAPKLGELTDVVTRVRYDYNGEDKNGIKGSFAGVTPMPEPGNASFKQLSELLESDVISWLEIHADKPHMQERIQKQIDVQVAPKHVDTPLPWAVAEEIVVEEVIAEETIAVEETVTNEPI